MKKSAVLFLAVTMLLCTACSDSAAPAKVYEWQDYFEAHKFPFGEDFELKFELEEFPDTVFIWKDYTIYASENGEEQKIASGEPLWNAFFTDLNADGYPELCATASWGSGDIDNHIIVYDYHNEKVYTLWERAKFDYSLFQNNGELCVRKVPFGRDPRNDYSDAEIGRLAIENDVLVMKK